jgi:uroporphyrinogen III methyltransferase/synthase
VPLPPEQILKKLAVPWLRASSNEELLICSPELPRADMRRSLRGQRIVITRAAHQSEDLAQALRELGAEPVLLPLIGIAPPSNAEPLEQAAQNANSYDWIIFTSANAVSAFARLLPETGEFFRPRVATVGSATAEVADQYGFRVELVPERFVAEALAQSFRPFPLDGKHILIPCAAGARDVVPNELRRRGAVVDVVEAYQNVIPEESRLLAREIFTEPLPDWVTFASSSALHHLVEIIGTDILHQVKIATIGPVTSATAAEHGLTVRAEARQHTTAGMVEAMMSNC